MSILDIADMKRILFLGGAAMQIPSIQYARDRGHYVITCDYLPDNPGHKIAHEYHNVSTTDKEAVLKLARQLSIDGIVAYASDPAAPTAAFVGNALGLPSNPYESVMILARKDLFRRFLADNAFNVPRSKSFYDVKLARQFADLIKPPLFIKPVDSSGSKGITRLEDINCFDEAFTFALTFSREKKIVVEEAIERNGYQIDSDVFVVDGEIKVCCWGDQHQEKLCSGIVPIGISFPSVIDENVGNIAKCELKRILELLDIKSGAFNIEFLLNPDDKIYFLEVGPRNGGNLIPDVMRHTIGADMIAATVDAALGEDCSSLAMTEPLGFYASYILHALRNGIFKDVYLSERIRHKILEQNLLVKVGDPVCKFNGSNDTLGTMILQFASQDEMLDMMDNMEEDIRVELS